MGEWMKFNNRSIYGCTEAPSDFTAPANTLLTYNPVTKRLYVHLLAYPLGNLTMSNMADKVRYVQFLHDASEIRFRAGSDEAKNDLILSLPVQKPQVEIPVLEIFLK
jgi:alpha-L-fucosidase